jgi:hypothetical protein
MIFQIISSILLENFWRHWFVGLILFIVHIIIIGISVLFLQKQIWSVAYVLKIFEFLLSFFLLGWAAGYFGY